MNAEDVIQHLLECNTRNSLIKQEQHLGFAFVKNSELRNEADRARKQKNFDLMKKKLLRHINYFSFFERDFLSENRYLE